MNNCADHNVKMRKIPGGTVRIHSNQLMLMPPQFSEQECYDYFSNNLRKTSHACNNFPSWMKKVNDPTVPFDVTVPSYSEITKIVHKMKASASACHLDQISVLVLKNNTSSYYLSLLEDLEIWIHRSHTQKGFYI